MNFQREEYEIQFYDFCLEDFVEQTKLMVEEIASKVVRNALKKIHEKEGGHQPTEEEQKALTRTIANVTQGIVRNMKSYEDLLEKYLSIPEYVILPEDKDHDVVKCPIVSEADMINAKIQSQMLEAEVTETAKVVISLEGELEQYVRIKQTLVDMESLLELVESRMDVSLKPADQKTTIKYIEGLIVEKNERRLN